MTIGSEEDRRLRAFLDERDRAGRRRNLLLGAAAVAVVAVVGHFVVMLVRHVSVASALQARGVVVDLYLKEGPIPWTPRSSVSYRRPAYDGSERNLLRPEDGRLLAELQGLESLYLTNCPDVRDELIERMGPVDTLTDLRLEFGETGGPRSRGRLTNAALPTIGRCRNLTILSLAGQRITDAGLPALMNLDQLEDLDLDRTMITDAGMASLGKLPKLKFLRVADAKVTDAGVVEFQKTNPQITVVRVTE